MRSFAVLFVLMGAVAAYGQEVAKERPHGNYRLEFVLKQLEHGKVISTRHYVISVGFVGNNSNLGQIRTGDRVPVDVGGDKGVNYIDIGFNCDARIMVDRVANDNKLPIEVDWDMSTMPQAADHTQGAGIIRQNRVRSAPLVELGKPTVVGSVDNLTSDQQFELDVTVTPET